MVTCFDEARGDHLYVAPAVERLMRALWMSYFKLPIDTLPTWGPDAIKYVRRYFFESEWYEALDLVEFLSSHSEAGATLRDFSNTILEREVSAYRFVGEAIAEITSAEEIAEVEAALDVAGTGARIHLQQAIAHLSDRSNPDYRNAVKEAISAVEGTLNEVTGTSNLTLGEGLKRLNIELHGGFRAALGNLYGYTSDGDGIRHSLLEEPNLDYADAKFMVVACAAFINYLLAKTRG